MPPAAALECDRTGWTLLMIATVAPERAAASAARWPARPAPMINTSWEGMMGESIGGTGPDASRARVAPEGGTTPLSSYLRDEHDRRPLPPPRAGARGRRPRRRPLPRARDPAGRGARRRVRRGGRHGARRRRRPGGRLARRRGPRRPDAGRGRLRGGGDAARAPPRPADPAALGRRRRRGPPRGGGRGDRGVPVQGPLRGHPAGGGRPRPPFLGAGNVNGARAGPPRRETGVVRPQAE